MSADSGDATYRYKICGDFEYILLVDETASIERYNGTATAFDIPSALDRYKVTSLDDYVFYGDESLVSVAIPESVTSISDSAFRNCENLCEIKIDSNNKVYDSRENCNAIIESATNTLIVGCKDTVIPDNISGIGTGAFTGCVNLTSIIIPKSVTNIGQYAFETKNDNTCLYVCENSYAHKYAKLNGFSYEFVDSDDSDNVEGEVSVFGTGDILLCAAVLIVIAAIVLCILLLKKKRK